MLLCSHHDVFYFTHWSDNVLIKNERRQLKLNVAEGKEDNNVMGHGLSENAHVLLCFLLDVTAHVSWAFTAEMVPLESLRQLLQFIHI